MDGDTVQEMGVAVGAAAGRPTVIPTTAARGRRLDGELAEQIAEDARRLIEPLPDLRGNVDYKRHVVGVLTSRALKSLSGRTDQ
jgi:carbon-monoxide dehydrogenase medium subunit